MAIARNDMLQDYKKKLIETFMVAGVDFERFNEELEKAKLPLINQIKEILVHVWVQARLGKMEPTLANVLSNEYPLADHKVSGVNVNPFFVRQVIFGTNKMVFNQLLFDAVEEALQMGDLEILRCFYEAGLLDVLSNAAMPLTIAGKCAAEGEWDKVRLLQEAGANRSLIFMGAASVDGDAQYNYLMQFQEQWTPGRNQNGILMAAAYGRNERFFSSELAGQILDEENYCNVVNGALANRTDIIASCQFVERVITRFASGCMNRFRLERSDVNFINTHIKNDEDAVFFLSQFKNDAFRQQFVNELRGIQDIGGGQLRITNDWRSCLPRAQKIRGLMDAGGLDYAAAKEKADQSYFSRAYSVLFPSRTASAASNTAAREGLAPSGCRK